MQAAIYARISHDPRGESLGVTRQREDCAELAERIGWTIAEVYTDNDTSATSGTPRPEYRRMLADIEAGRIGAVIAWHVDRLYRKLDDLQDLIKVVEGNDVAVRTVQAGDFDLSTATGRGIARILGSVATMEGEQKSERWRRSWRQRRELGHVTPAGWRTFGYTRDGQILEEEATRLRQAADDILNGKAIRAVCDELNAEGFTTTRKHGRWTNTALRVLLRNPRIAGYATYKGAPVGDGDWQPILDRETWQGLKVMLAARSTTRRPRKWLLSGMLTCGICGATLQARPGRGYQAYKCVSADGGCGKIDVRADRAEEVVEAYARHRLADERVRRRLTELRAGGHGHVLAEVDALQHRLGEVEQQMLDPGRSMNALVRAADTLRSRIDEMQAQLVTTTPVTLPTADNEWPSDLHVRRRLISLVVRSVTVDPSPGRGRFHAERVRIDPS